MMYLSMFDAAQYIMYKRQLSDIITSYSKIIDILSKYRFRQYYVQIFGPKTSFSAGSKIGSSRFQAMTGQRIQKIYGYDLEIEFQQLIHLNSPEKIQICTISVTIGGNTLTDNCYDYRQTSNREDVSTYRRFMQQRRLILFALTII